MSSIDFQKQVYVNPAQIVAGDIFDSSFLAESLAPTADGYRAANTLNIGTFVWETSTGAGKLVDSVQTAGVATALPVGFVPRQLNIGTFDSTTTGYGYAIPAGREVKPYSRGTFAAVAGTADTAGRKVFAKTADGTLVLNAPGATVAGAIETVFWAKPLLGKTAIVLGDVVMISSQPTV